MRRVDISNGIVFLDCKLSNRAKTVELKNLDRMIVIVMPKSGSVTINDHLSGIKHDVREGDVGVFGSSRQDMEITVNKSKNSDVFILFIADFFLKRYLSDTDSEPVDFLYSKIQKEVSLEHINTQPIDALSLYIVDKLLEINSSARLASIKAEHRVSEFIIHRLSLLDTPMKDISKDEMRLANRAKNIILKNFISSQNISELSHLCATNESKLKKVFKKVYKTTIHAYIQKLRLEEANILLKERSLNIGEVAKRVGYLHQGHFSKLFFDTYGVYPKDLK